MELYLGSMYLLATAEIYATKTNKPKSLEVCKVASDTFKRYISTEFMLFKAQDDEILDFPTSTLKERYNFIYLLVKDFLTLSVKKQ